MTMTPSNPSQNQATQAPAPLPTQQSAAMTLAGDMQFRLALEPTTFNETMQVCEMIASVRLCGCETPVDALIRVMTGRALGLTVMTSMQGVYVVDGKPGLYAELMAALCLQSPLCEEFRVIEATPQKATVRAKRRGKEAQDVSFDIEQARQANLLDRGSDPKKNNWNRFTTDMLIARATSRAAKRVFADVIRGMSSVEELTDGAAPDEREMVGEVVPSAPPTNTPARDFSAESKAMLAKVEAITDETPPAARKPIREELLAWDAPDSWKKVVIDAYNSSPKYAARKPAAAPAEPSHTETKPSTREHGQEG